MVQRVSGLARKTWQEAVTELRLAGAVNVCREAAPSGRWHHIPTA